MKIVSSIPVSDNFASKIDKMNPANSEFIPSAVTTEYFKNNKFNPKDIFGRSLQIQTGQKSPITLERGKKMYYGSDKLSYMDKAIDLSQPDYKRYMVGKTSKNIENKF